MNKQYEYKVVSGLVTPDVKKKESFESCLEKTLNENSVDGWEFYCQNTINEFRSPGCLGTFAGVKGTVVPHQVFVFRREIKK